MATEVTPIQWGWWCGDCIAGGHYDSEGMAEDAAERHDNECHGADS